MEGEMKKRDLLLSLLTCCLLLSPALLFAQTSKPRELKVGYPLGGSASYFWVAYRSGSFEKQGLKLEPIYIRGGLMGIQAALSGDLPLQLQGASTVVAAWAQSAPVWTTFSRRILRLKSPKISRGRKSGLASSDRARISLPGWLCDGSGSILRRTCRSSALVARETVGPRSTPDRFKPACFNPHSP